MSSIKEYMFDLAGQHADKWIREQLDDADCLIDENSEEYQSLFEDYCYVEQAKFDAAESQAEWEAELKWLKNNGSSFLHKGFMSQLNNLRGMASSNLADAKGFNSSVNGQLASKMAYAYAVTLLEAFLGDTLNALLNENPEFLKKAIANVEELKKARYGLSELNFDNLTVLSLATRKLAEIHFHNIPKVMMIYEQVLGHKLRVDFSKVNEITIVRHDIVHRNGKTIDGIPIYIDAESLQVALDCIQKFASDLQVEINKATH